MQYQSIQVASKKKEAELKLESAFGEELCLLLLGLYEIDDWKWVQDVYLKYASNEDRWVASSAITGLGHLARVAGKLDFDKVLGVLNAISNDRPELSGKVNDAVSDINMFLNDQDKGGG